MGDAYRRGAALSDRPGVPEAGRLGGGAGPLARAGRGRERPPRQRALQGAGQAPRPDQGDLVANRRAVQGPARPALLRAAQRAARGSDRRTVAGDVPAPARRGPGIEPGPDGHHRPGALEQRRPPPGPGASRERPEPDRHVPLLQPVPLHPPGGVLGRGERQVEGRDVDGHRRAGRRDPEGLRQGGEVGQGAQPAALPRRVRRLLRGRPQIPGHLDRRRRPRGRESWFLVGLLGVRLPPKVAGR